MDLKEFSKALSFASLDSRFAGLVNSESGNIGFSSESFSACEVCSGQDTLAIQFECSSCGRSSDSYLFTPSGDGDGIYALWILERSGQSVGLIAIYDSDYKSANYARQELTSGRLPKFSVDSDDPCDIAMSVSAGVMRIRDSIWVSDVYGGADSSPNYVRVRLKNLSPGLYEAFSFIEPTDASSGPLAPRGVDTVRAVALIDSAHAKMLGLTPAQYDWASFLGSNLHALVTSHVEPMGESVASINELADSISTHALFSESQVGEASHCAQCGRKFAADRDRFCSVCGTARSSARQRLT